MKHLFNFSLWSHSPLLGFLTCRGHRRDVPAQVLRGTWSVQRSFRGQISGGLRRWAVCASSSRPYPESCRPADLETERQGFWYIWWHHDMETHVGLLAWRWKYKVIMHMAWERFVHHWPFVSHWYVLLSEMVLCLPSYFENGTLFSRRGVRLDDVITWKRFPYYWPFVMGIHWLPVDSPHKGPVMRSFDGFNVVSRNKMLNKRSSCCWFETYAHMTSL